MRSTPARRWRALAAVGVIAATVAACGGDDQGDEVTEDTAASTASVGTGTATTDPSDTGDAPATSAAPDGGCTAERTGGSLAVGVYSEAQGLDPAGAPGAGTTGGSERAAIFDTLLRYNPETGVYEPRLAEAVTPNEDASTWTIEIRPDVRFGNGDAFDAEAVAASLQRHIAPVARSTVRRVLSGATVTVVDDLTLTVTLQQAWAGFPFVLAREAGMITNPSVVATDPEGFALDPGAGAGPYQVVTSQPGEPLVLTARPDYWGGPVCIEELTFEYVVGNQARYDAVELDELQVAFLSDPGIVADANAAGYPGIDNLAHWGGGLLFNSGARGGTPPTTDVRVRQAIALAIDPEQINTRVWGGEGLPTKALVAPQSRLSPGVDGQPYDPEAARALVAEVQADGWDGRVRLLCNNDPERVDASIAIEAMLESVGMDVDLDNSATIQTLVTAVNVDADYDVACWGPSGDDGGLWLTYNNLASTSPQNVSGLADPAMDAALAALAAADDDDGIKAAVADMQTAWNAESPGVVYSSTNYRIIHTDGLHGLTSTASSIVLFDDAYLES